MSLLTEIQEEFAHIGHLFQKDSAKLAHFLSPIISDMAKLVSCDLAGDLPLAVEAIEAAVAAGTGDPAALALIAANAVKDVIKKQALSVGVQAMKATEAAIIAQAAPASIPSPVIE